jgi:hypothetical protein
MRTHFVKPKTIGGGRDRRTAARLVVNPPNPEAHAPRGGRDASCVPERPGRRRLPGCFPQTTLPGGGCFLSGGAPPLPN